MSAALPEAFERELSRLGASAWRERKQAVESLRRMLTSASPDDLTGLSDRLIDGLLSPEELDGRAACQEVLVAIGRPVLPAVVERLQRPGPLRRLLIDLVGQIGGESQVAMLKEIVADGAADANLRASAAAALGNIGGSSARAALSDLLLDPSDMLQVYALDALRTAAARIPVQEIEGLIGRRFTRKSAAALLGLSCDAAALPILIPLLDDGMAGVRAVTAGALVRLDEDLTEAGEEGLVTAALGQLTDPTRVRVRELIEHPKRTVRAAAIRLAAMAGDAQAVAQLLTVMDDPLIQEQALAMITALGPAAAGALEHAAERAGGAHREHFLRLLGALAPEFVGESLLSLLNQGLQDPSEDTAVSAAESLARVGDRTCLAELYRAMAQGGRLGEAAADAVAAILRGRGAASHDDLTLIVGSTWPQEGALARNLCRVVGGLGSHRYAPHLVSLLGSTDVGVRIAAAVALGQLQGEHEGASALSFALTDEEPQVRASACRSLGMLRAPQSCQSLLSATGDRSPMVRAAAVQALVALDNPVALARFRAIIAEDPVPTVVVQAIAGLGSSGLDQDLTMLMSLCTSEDREVVKAAARALVRFPAHRATAALLGLLDHDRWDVRWAAAEVLADRGDLTAVIPLRRALDQEQDRLVCQAIGDAVARLEADA